MKNFVFCLTLSFFATTLSAQKINDSNTQSNQTILLKVSKTYTTPLLHSISLKQSKKKTNALFKAPLNNSLNLALKSTEEIIRKRKNKKLYS